MGKQRRASTDCSLTVSRERDTYLWSYQMRLRMSGRLLCSEYSSTSSLGVRSLSLSQDAKGVCVPRVICAPPNILTPISDGIKSTCTCAAGYKSDGNGGCVLGATGRARLTRSMMKRVVPAHPHAARPGGAAHKKIVKGRSLVDQAREQLYPFGETACPLSSGGFECLDVTSSLVSCGGCVGDGMPGKNCLAM